MKEELALVGLNWSRDAIGRKEQTALTGQESISFTTAAASTHDFSKQTYISFEFSVGPSSRLLTRKILWEVVSRENSSTKF